MPGVPLLVLQPLPVLAVSLSGMRRAGLVVLDRLGNVQAAKLLYLRRLSGPGEKFAAVRREAEALASRFAAASVVLEANPGRGSLDGLRLPLREVCERQVAWFREMPLSSAIRSLGAGDRGQLALELAGRYPQLGARLDLAGRRVFGLGGRAYEHRAIVDAFILAHAAVAEAWRAANVDPPPPVRGPLCATPSPASP